LSMKFLLQSLRLRNARILNRTVSWRPDLKVWSHWLVPGISWIRLVAGKVSRSLIIQLATFARHCVTIGRNSGRKGLVLYLKSCNVLLVQALPGSLLSFDSRRIGGVAVACTRDGIPRIIPAFARQRIRLGDKLTIQLWLSFFGIYRVMPCKGKVSFETILASAPKLGPQFEKDWVTWVRKRFLPMVSQHTDQPLVDIGTSVLAKPVPVVISSVSADKFEDPRIAGFVNGLKLDQMPVPFLLSGTPTAYAHRLSSASLWTKTALMSTDYVQPGEAPKPSQDGFYGLGTNILLDYLRLIPGGYGTTRSFWTLLEHTARYFPMARAATRAPMPSGLSSERKGGVEVLANAHGWGTNLCGRLALLPEPAGKVRVVALADIWTQWALKPLHDWLFDILREIPQDGTFDQLRPVNRLLKLVPPTQAIYSYDLSAATDCIPVRIQELLLAQIFGPAYAKAWANLLVGRPYSIPKKVAKGLLLSSRFLKYGTGQPMGAYSSWGMLALIHHAMVQYSAYRAGVVGWFVLYAVLGDDVVIAHDRVARKYRALCRLLRVKIGLQKSMVSTGRSLEFAKRLFFRGEDVSGLPAKFWAAAQGQASVAVALAAWSKRGTLSNFLRALGAGFKVASGISTARWSNMNRRARALAVTLTNPVIGSRFAFKTWPEWLWSESADTSRPLPEETLTAFSPFCQSVQSVLVQPALESLEAYQEDLFFKRKLEDPVTVITDGHANKAMLEAETSITKASESLAHLQRLNIKFNLVQVSAILSQIWRSVEKAGLVPLPSTKATVRTEVDPHALKVTSVYKHWSSLRSKAAPMTPAEVAAEGRDPYGEISKGKVVSTTVLEQMPVPVDKQVTGQVETPPVVKPEDDDDDLPNMDEFF